MNFRASLTTEGQPSRSTDVVHVAWPKLEIAMDITLAMSGSTPEYRDAIDKQTWRTQQGFQFKDKHQIDEIEGYEIKMPNICGYLDGD